MRFVNGGTGSSSSSSSSSSSDQQPASQVQFVKFAEKKTS